VSLVLSRQNLPVLDRNKYPAASEIKRGGYVVSDSKGKPDVIFIASGSEVHLCLEAAEKLRGKGVKARVVNMACFGLFDAQPKAYRDRVLPPDVEARLAVEAASPFGWHKYAGLKGDVLCMESFGASAPGKVVFERFGFTVDNVVKRAIRLVRRG
jgi:transketolase